MWQTNPNDQFGFCSCAVLSHCTLCLMFYNCRSMSETDQQKDARHIQKVLWDLQRDARHKQKVPRDIQEDARYKQKVPGDLQEGARYIQKVLRDIQKDGNPVKVVDNGHMPGMIQVQILTKPRPCWQNFQYNELLTVTFSWLLALESQVTINTCMQLSYNIFQHWPSTDSVSSNAALCTRLPMPQQTLAIQIHLSTHTGIGDLIMFSSNMMPSSPVTCKDFVALRTRVIAGTGVPSYAWGRAWSDVLKTVGWLDILVTIVTKVIHAWKTRKLGSSFFPIVVLNVLQCSQLIMKVKVFLS